MRASTSPSSTRRLLVAFTLLTVASVARLLLQMAVMPPYAGLDELFHVARLAFRCNEDRDPDPREKSFTPYLASTLWESPEGVLPNRRTVMPSFALAGARWPEMVAQGLAVDGSEPLYSTELRPYFSRNYEAQQPALYYALHAPLAQLDPARSAESELRIWRRASALFALITVLATAFIGYRYAGMYGVLAAALLVSFPTWQTLVSRAGNDAMACAAIAIGLAVTISAPSRWPGWLLEAGSWGVAAAVKLYSWPLFPIAALFWFRQRASKWRVITVIAVVALAAIATMIEMRSRTSNPLGLFMFDPVPDQAVESRVPIDLGLIARITITTGVWMSGQHGNVLSDLGMVLYAIPIVLLCLAGIYFDRKSSSERNVPYGIVGAALFLFGVAQAVNIVAYLRQPVSAGLPAGGKEGWYWYSLAPLVVGLVFAGAVRGLIRRSRALAVLLFTLVIGWDIAISEGALFRDYAGVSSPSTPTQFFRWGSTMDVSLWDLERHLMPLTIDPLVTWAVELRAMHLLAIALLLAVVLNERRRSWVWPSRPSN